MRILLIAPMLPHTHGAGGIPVLLTVELVGLGARHEVTLLAGIGDEPGEEDAARALMREGVDLHLAERRRPSTRRRHLERRLRLATSWASGRRPWRTVWFAAPSAQATLDRLSAARSFDVVPVEDSSMALFRAPGRVPTVLTEHEIQRPDELGHLLGPPSSWPRWAPWELDRRRWKHFQSAAWRRFDLVQVFGDRVALAVEELASDIAPCVRVNPFGLVPRRVADSSREQPGTALFVGNFTHPPNRHAALCPAREIMPAVKVRHPGARWRIVGSARPPKVTERAGPSVVIGDALAVQPHLGAPSVRSAPRRRGGGMRLKVLHALASGKPVVSRSRGADGYATARRTLPLVVADDTEGIAFATAGLLDDAGRRRQLGVDGRAFALEHHNPAAWASRLERIYEAACSRQPGGARA